jgi:hypothetical protein
MCWKNILSNIRPALPFGGVPAGAAAARAPCAGVRRGRVVQIDPMKPKLKPPGTKRLKLEYDGLLSNFGFKFNLRRYTVDTVWLHDPRHWFDTDDLPR